METNLTRNIKVALLKHYRVDRDMYAVQECINMDVLVCTKDFKKYYEFEVKVSKHDLLKDAKKPKHKARARTNYFYYVVPEDLTDTAIDLATRLNKKYGVITYRPTYFHVAKKAYSLGTVRSLIKPLLNNMSYQYIYNYEKIVIYERDREKSIPTELSTKACTIYRNLLKGYSLDIIKKFVYDKVVDTYTYGRHTIRFGSDHCMCDKHIYNYKKSYGNFSWIENTMNEVAKWVQDKSKDTLFML